MRRPIRASRDEGYRMRRVVTALLLACSVTIVAAADDPYDVLLHSTSLEAQRTAVASIVARPRAYKARIQRTLRNYARLLDTDRVAANRAVYLAALIRDRSFTPLLVDLLHQERVESECIYSCAPVFALSVYAHYGGWKVPKSITTDSDPGFDLRQAVKAGPPRSLEKRPLTERIPDEDWVRAHEGQLRDKSEAQIIAMAGPETQPHDTREFAALALGQWVTSSTNRLDLYLLAMNDIEEDASREYLYSVHAAIQRAEFARTKGR